GGAVRLLPQRRHPHGQGVPRSESPGHRVRDPRLAVDGAVPLLHSRADAAGDSSLSARPGRMSDATGMATRREFLERAGGLSVDSGAVGATGGFARVLAQGTRATAGQLDSWLAVASDGTVTAYTGKCELGQGMQTAQIQLIAEELGVAVDRVHLLMCDT